jgi:predicted ATP-grasp superfamily ATP-dependent carboligase
MAGYQGTLAATRCLGAYGVPVTIADPALLAPARWSRFATRRHSCPPVQEADRFVEWLLQFGRRYPGHVLYPTSDDIAWLCALHREEIASSFHLYQPPVEVLYTLLNKRRLQQACSAAGIETPPAWFAADDGELDRLYRDLPYPILIKPQTQILYWPHAKGTVAHSAQELRGKYQRFMRVASYAPSFLARHPEAARPMLQAYLPAAVEGIYNLSGFIDVSGELFAVRASRKVLQRPRQLGVGLCFEEAEIDHRLAAQLRTLCRQVGYHGVFEAEFIEEGERAFLIDFNPRFFGQMAFDIQRGLPLPLLVHRAALGRRDLLRATLDRTRDPGEGRRGRIYFNRIELAMLLRVQRLAGKMSGAEVRRWQRLAESPHASPMDAVLDPDDRAPGVAHLVSEVLHYLRHPRSLLEQLASGT